MRFVALAHGSVARTGRKRVPADASRTSEFVPVMVCDITAFVAGVVLPHVMHEIRSGHAFLSYLGLQRADSQVAIISAITAVCVRHSGRFVRSHLAICDCISLTARRRTILGGPVPLDTPPSGIGGGQYAQRFSSLSRRTCVLRMVVFDGPIADNASLAHGAEEVLGDKTVFVFDLPR